MNEEEKLYRPHSDEELRIEHKNTSISCLAKVLFRLILLVFLCLIFYQLILVRFICDGEFCSGFNSDPHQPEQLHLSLGANDSEVYVTWSTQKPTESSVVLVNPRPNEPDCFVGRFVGERHGLDLKNLGENEQKGFYRLYTYRARVSLTYKTCIKGLTECVFEYYVETSYPIKLRSNRYSFKAPHLSKFDKSVNVAFFGDLGWKNAQSVGRLTRDVEKNLYHLIIHNGDFAYDLDTDRGRYGDRFMRLIEPIAAKVPYQTSVGNHEIAHNFSDYDHRFTMVNSGGHDNGRMNNFYYSFNAGPIHFIAISTEFYYFLDSVGIEPLTNQYKWLIDDLQIASTPAERAKRPWIVVFGHRPMYCSTREHDDCSKETNLLRHGLPFLHTFALEKLFYEHGVDALLWSHEHMYERFLPIYDGKIMNGTDPNRPYHNPRAPVHIISGAAGCQEKVDKFTGVPVTGSVRQISDYGYTRLRSWNIGSSYYLSFEQVSDDQQGTIVDHFDITKDQIRNFP